MTEWWPVLLGWPAALFALTLSALGLLRKRAWYLHAATILILPISLYLATTPRFRIAALLAPLALLAAGIATKYGKTHLALAMVLPVIFFFGWLALIVLQQSGYQN